MRILFANKFHYYRGGDCSYTLNLGKLMKSKGHEVAYFSMAHPENLECEYSEYFPSEVDFSGTKNPMKILKSLYRPFGSLEVKKKFIALLDCFKPDVVHLNNIHSQISPVIVEIAYKRGIKVVWTLHDYKLICPRYDTIKDGKDCSECYENGCDNKIRCLFNKCVKNSLPGSLLGWMEALKWNRDYLVKMVDCFICPSDFMRNKMLIGGFPENKLKTLCNFIDVGKCEFNEMSSKGDYYCYVGRISEEKGIRTLVEVASKLPFKLVVVGDGHAMEDCRKIVSDNNADNIEFVGYKSWDYIKGIYAKSLFSVLPSEWNENNPFSIIESQALGVPVLGARRGGIPELIEENLNGLLFESGSHEDLHDKIKMMYEIRFDYEMISKKGHTKYSEDAYYRSILRIYKEVNLREVY